MPPSTTSVVPGDPLARVAAQERRRRWRCPRARRAASAACSGPCASSFGSHSARAMSVFTRPGAMALTRTAGASSPASCRVRWMQRRLGAVVDADRSARRACHRPTPRSGRRRRAPAWTPVHAAWRPDERPALVHLDGLVEAGRVDVDGRAHVRVGGRVVHQDVEARRSARAWRRRTPRPARSHRRWRRTRPRRAVGRSLGDGRPPRASSALRDDSITLAPAGGERRRDGLADALRRARDQRDLSVQSDVHPPD